MKTRLLGVLAIALMLSSVSAPLFAQRTEDLGSVVSPAVQPAPGSASPMVRGSNVLYDNGPLITDVGTGAGGADESSLESALGLNTLGFGIQGPDTRMADQFSVPAGEEWNIETCTFYTYQTGAPATSTITAASFRIWDGSPDDGGSSVIAGDDTLDALVDTGFSNIYRVTDITSGDTQRAVFFATLDVQTTLTEGTYWMDWAAEGTVPFSGPWAPPITIAGQATTGDALQFFGGAWQAALDTGIGTPQGIPFFCNGEVANNSVLEVPTVGTWGLGLLGLLLAATAFVTLRRLT